MNKIESLRIEYNVKGGEDKKLYDALCKVAKKNGFKWYAQGFNTITKTRDISFLREPKQP